MSLVALCAALTACGAFIKIPLWPVAITLQTFFVILSGIILGPRYGALSQLVYIILGLLGLPVFSGGGGLAYVMRPSFGYLAGFIIASSVVGLFMRNRGLTHKTVCAASVIGTLVIYGTGTPYLAAYMHLVLDKPDAAGLAIKTGMLVFLPGDMLKCLILTLIVPRLGLRKNIQGTPHR